MSKQTINIGASPNDGTGTPLRTSFDYTNQNFTELYTALGGGVGLPGATTQVIFNDGGTNLAGDSGLTFNKTTDTLSTARITASGDAIVCSSTGDFYVGTTISPQFKVERATGNATITGDLTVDTSTLKVDSTNDRVGIGTATPGSRLDVRFATNPAINNAVPTNALRVFTSVAQAVDVGGQIGLGGLFDATQFQAFGNISGKKENSTSGNNAGYLVVGTCDSGGTMAERYRIGSTGISTWSVAGTTAMTLDSTGLNVVGKTAINGASLTYPLNVRASSSNVGNTAFLFEQLDGTPILTMRDNGTVIVAGDIRPGNPVNTVSPTSPNRTITMIVNGVTLYIPAKTTND